MGLANKLSYQYPVFEHTVNFCTVFMQPHDSARSPSICKKTVIEQVYGLIFVHWVSNN